MYIPELFRVLLTTITLAKVTARKTDGRIKRIDSGKSSKLVPVIRHDARPVFL